MAACRPLVAYKQKLQDILHEGIALDILKRIGRARMRLEQLTYLVSAAKAGSISAAAQRLNVSRQAVSSALGSLESELGVPFFKKGNQGIEPTFRGRAILGESGGCPEADRGTASRGKDGWDGKFFSMHHAAAFSLSDQQRFFCRSGSCIRRSMFSCGTCICLN